MFSEKDAPLFVVFVLVAAAAAVIALLLSRPAAEPQPQIAVLPSPAAADATPELLPSEVVDQQATATAEEPVATEALPTRSPTPEATPMPAPSATPAREGRFLGNGVWLVAQLNEWEEPGQVLLSFDLPRLEGETLGQVDPFNREVDGQANIVADDLRNGVVELGFGEGGGASIRHTVFLASERMLSVRLDFDFYIMGQAHPAAWTYAINYDPATGRLLTLGDLFLPGSDYLGVISRYCLADLERQGVLAWADGALPTSENYNNKWNVTDAGLLINFDNYTVAPYAAGPQSVVVPYRELRGVAAPGGPLGAFMP